MKSPYGIYKDFARRGQLAYQVNRTGEPVFYPRVMDLETADSPEWRVSAGRGEVYAYTVLHERDGVRRNLSLIQLDEGFRMMSRVEEIDPADVRIGMKVCVVFRDVADEDGPLAIFVPQGEGNA